MFMAYENGVAQAKGLTFSFHLMPTFRGTSHWRYLRLDVHHPDEPEAIGYLRVAFIPLSVAEAMNQERLLLVDSRGHSMYPPPPKGPALAPRFHYEDPATWEGWKNDPSLAARYVMETVLRWNYSAWNDGLRLPAEELVALVEAYRSQLNAFTQQQLESMFAFGVNKADVDYALLESPWQGQGIAPSMYRAMAHYLDEHHGITLNASTTQSPQAQRCWQRMKDQGLVAPDEKGRLFFVEGVSSSTLEARQVLPTPVLQPSRSARRTGRPRA